MMICPKCHKTVSYVCSNLACVCRQGVDPGDIMVEVHQDENRLSCPYCGLTEHICYWADLEISQYLESRGVKSFRELEEKEK